MSCYYPQFPYSFQKQWTQRSNIGFFARGRGALACSGPDCPALRNKRDSPEMDRPDMSGYINPDEGRFSPKLRRSIALLSSGHLQPSRNLDK